MHQVLVPTLGAEAARNLFLNVNAKDMQTTGVVQFMV